MRFILTLIILVIPSSLWASSITYDSELRIVSNWKSEAYAHLNIDSESLSKHKYKRCIKLNNYWCLKDVGWNGSVGRDGDKHTAFKNGYYAARAAVRNFRTAYFKHGRKSAIEIIAAYAPTNDCVGSNGARRSDGTCIYGNNNSTKYAKTISQGITGDIDQDLQLFDSKGRATNNLTLFLINMSAFETGGLKVASETIEKGICMENASC